MKSINNIVCITKGRLPIWQFPAKMKAAEYSQQRRSSTFHMICLGLYTRQTKCMH